MKKLFTVLFITINLIGWGQCPINQAVDFTATDVHGTEVHLFDILNQGQYVLMDFFFTTCGTCQQTVPNMVQSYHATGCNQHDVYFMEIDLGDSDAACLGWAENYSVEYPTISGAGGGTNICNAYGISSFPTVILIAPDRQIVVQDLWPLNTVQTILNTLESQGVEQHPCYETTLTLSTDTITFILGTSGWNDGQLLQVSNYTAESEVTLTSFDQEYLHTTVFDAEQYSFVYEGETYSHLDTFNITIPQGETVDLYFYVLPWAKAYPYNTRLTFHNTLEPFSVIASIDHITSVDENDAVPTLFPNPANDVVTVRGQDLGTVRIYNMLGQTMDVFEADGPELRIPTTRYENGVYFIQSNNASLRFMVSH